MGRHKRVSDADLLEAARDAFVEGGLAVPTREIARRAGVSEAVLFQRYATKAELFFAAMVLPAPDLVHLVAAPARGAAGRQSGEKRLERLAAGLLDYFRQTLPVLLPLMSHPEFRFEEFARTHPGSPLDVLRRDLMTFFREEQQAGRIGAAVDPGAAALMVFSLAQCIAFFERMGAHGGRFPPEILERSVICLWQGLAPGRRGRRSRGRRSRESLRGKTKP
jgi:AcrR family transcriptional regulator